MKISDSGSVSKCIFPASVQVYLCIFVFLHVQLKGDFLFSRVYVVIFSESLMGFYKV